MSYGASEALQRAVYDALSSDAAVAAAVGDAVFDSPPEGEAPALYVALGAEDASARPDSSGGITSHRILISVVGRQSGFATLKAVGAAVSDRLDQGALSLARGRLVGMDFLKARARRRAGNRDRRIDLWFRALVDDS